MARLPKLDPVAVAETGARLRENIQRAVKVDDGVVRDLLVALLAEGHVLIEDYPGVGKTALARALARSVDAEYARVQCTVDLLPADVIGTNVFNQREARFEFHPGPVFANVVLVDEINRTSPKTQSGLLECMQERHVTVDGQPHELARPFIVIATQNPVEYEGTYPLPEAQLDRFMVRLALGYPDGRRGGRDARDARRRTTGFSTSSRSRTSRRCSPRRRRPPPCTAAEALRRYVVALCEATRADARVELGASPRAALLLFRAAKALAALEGRDHALPTTSRRSRRSVLAASAPARARARPRGDRRGGRRRRAGAGSGALGRDGAGARATLVLAAAFVLAGRRVRLAVAVRARGRAGAARRRRAHLGGAAARRAGSSRSRGRGRSSRGRAYRSSS